MPENPTEPTAPHDVRTIHQLVRLMKRYDLTAIDFVEGATKIRLRRRGPAYQPPAPSAPLVTPTSPAAPPPAPSTDIVIESPMVGTYYASPAPESPPFVSVGSPIRPDTTVCVIEAMKVFTDIPAGVTGTITEVLVKNGQPVEFGQPMFRVRPA
jgi:acetyl-CoA carboxylase biotin carboxyl carrier protein